MLLSLFDNLTAEKPIVQKEEESSFEKGFEVYAHGETVPVRILFESRFNNQVTVNKNGILIRVSNRQSKEEQRKNIDNLRKWARDKLGDKPELLESLPQRKYVNGEVLKVGNYEFVVSIMYHDHPKSTAKIFR